MAKVSFKFIETDGAPIKAWTKGVPMADNARAQLQNVAQMPFIHSHVAAMPDVHLGIGATVGSVIATKGAVMPASVGVDIGCGMMAVRTSLTSQQLPANLAHVRDKIEQAVPHGRSVSRGANSVVHLGTLGTGNHFLELCLDEEDRLWVMLHSGSRGVGNRIGSYFIAETRRLFERRFMDGHLPDKNLAFLVEGKDPLFDDYMQAVDWAQRFALVNRELMMKHTLRVLKKALTRFETDEVAVNCHHNYVARENHFGANVWVTRKGAVRAREGDLGIIPGSMGAKSFIVRGKGNAQSFHSCSHGAGRLMSRTEAKNTFTLADHRKATEGVECRKDEGVIDETPGAYKDIDAVMAAQADLVDVAHTLKQILCVKG